MHLPPSQDLSRPRRSIGKIELAVAIGIAICLAVRIARAQSAEAEALFEQGNQLMTDGKLAEACEAFEASKRLEPRAGTLIRLGECREANHQLASAFVAYREALARVKDPRKRDVATQHLAELEPKLSHLSIVVTDDARVDGLVVSRGGVPIDASSWNRPVALDGGTAVIAARAPGRLEWHTTITIPESGGALVVRVPRLDEPSRPVVVRTAAALPEPSRWTTRRKIAIGLAGGAAIASTVAVVLGRSARSLEQDAFARCDPSTPCADAPLAQATLDRAHQRALFANAGFAFGAGAAIAAGILWLTGAPPERVQATGAGIALRF